MIISFRNEKQQSVCTAASKIIIQGAVEDEGIGGKVTGVSFLVPVDIREKNESEIGRFSVLLGPGLTVIPLELIPIAIFIHILFCYFLLSPGRRQQLF